MSTIIAGFLLAAGVLLSSDDPRARWRTSFPKREKRRWNKTGLLALLLVAGIAGILLGRFSAVFSAAIAGITAWKLSSARLEEKRVRRRNEDLASFLGVVVGELKQGAELSSAVIDAAGNCRDRALQEALLAAGRHAKSGGSGGRILAGYATGMPELRAVASAWEVAEEHGISHVGLLENTRRRIDGRLRHESSTQAALQGAQATTLILAGLPLLGILLGFGMGVNVPAFLLGGGIGGILLASGVGLGCAGLMMSRAIIEGATK